MWPQRLERKVFLLGVFLAMLALSLGPLCAQTAAESALFSKQGIRQEDYAILLSLVSEEEAAMLQGYTISYFTTPLGEEQNIWGYARPYTQEIGFYVGQAAPFSAGEIFFHELGHVSEVYHVQLELEDTWGYCGETTPLPGTLSEEFAREYAARRLAELGL